MPNERLKQDADRNNVAGAVTNDANQFVIQLRVDPTTNRLLVDTAYAPVATASDYSVYGSAAAEDDAVVKASAGRVYGGWFSNANAAARYLHLFNSASAVSNGTVPTIVIDCDALKTSGFSTVDVTGDFFSAGIYVAGSTTQNTLTKGDNDFLFRIYYK